MSDGLLGNLLVKIIGDRSSLDAALDASEAKTKTTESRINASVSKIGDSFLKMGKALTLGVTTPIVGFGIAALKSLGDFQMYQASFETMLGSAEKAKTLITELQQKAAETPFTFDDLAQATKTLLQFGANLEDVQPIMQRIGDISGGNRERFQQLSLAYAQSAAAGRLMGQDLMQMINGGFNPLMVISKQTGETMGELKKRMEAGGISAREVAAAFASAASEGGQFYGGMERGSKTLPGLMSTLADNASAVGRSFAQIVAPAVEKFVKQVSGLVQGIAELEPETKKLILTFGGLAAAAGPVAIGINLIIKAFTAANPIMLAVTAAIIAVSSGITAFTVQADKAKRSTENLNDALAMTADLTITQKALDETAKKLENLYKVQKASPNSESIKKTIEQLEAQKAIIESNISSIIREQKAKEKAAEGTAPIITKEKDQLDSLRAARDAAAKEYEASLKSTRDLAASGLRTTEEAQEEVTAATRKYAEALVPVVSAAKELKKTAPDMYNKETGGAIIGAQSLGIAIGSLELAAKKAAAAMRDIPPLSPLDPEAVQSLADFDTFLAEFRERRRAEEEEESAALAKKKAEETAYLDIIKNGLNETNDAFVALGEAFVTGENPMKAFFKSLISTIGDSVIAFAALTEAQGWATWPLVDWAKVIKGAALAVLGGTVKAAAASLASGGVASGPTLAVVGDNPYADEMVAPLTPDTFRGFADGLLAALAERSRPAGVTEATVSAATVSGSSGAGSTVNLHVGTLIADDAGMRKLNRELRKFGLQENVRTGYGG